MNKAARACGLCKWRVGWLWFNPQCRHPEVVDLLSVKEKVMLNPVTGREWVHKSQFDGKMGTCTWQRYSKNVGSCGPKGRFFEHLSAPTEIELMQESAHDYLKEDAR